VAAVLSRESHALIYTALCDVIRHIRQHASRSARHTIADGILDRLVHNAHRIELRGESMRKTRVKKNESKEENET
jgi:DNA replication protein DnaC